MVGGIVPDSSDRQRGCNGLFVFTVVCSNKIAKPIYSSFVVEKSSIAVLFDVREQGAKS